MHMVMAELRRKIEARQATLGVIGLGYVGLPVACTFAAVGFRVIGIDIKADRVAAINAGRCPIGGNEPGLSELLASVVEGRGFRATTEYGALRGTDIILIDVETPVDDGGRPRFDALRRACTALGPVLKQGALVIVESTVAPGTTDRLVKPLLEETSSRKLNEGFYLGHCPERVMPGKLLTNLRSVGRVCGGSTPETARAMVALYRQVVQADLDPTDCLTAELVKTTENAYRDVQIAFANEVALICEAVGGDVWRVRELVNKVPFRSMHLPGPGVGGHCIPKDPWLLANAFGADRDVRLIRAARAVNDGMPWHVADLIARALAEAGCSIAGARVAVLGYAYLEDSDDTRNSPSEALVNRLRQLGAEVRIHDPWVEAYRGDMAEVVRECDAAVVMVGHSAYRSLDLAALGDALRRPIVVDARHLLKEASSTGVRLFVLGRGGCS